MHCHEFDGLRVCAHSASVENWLLILQTVAEEFGVWARFLRGDFSESFWRSASFCCMLNNLCSSPKPARVTKSLRPAVLWCSAEVTRNHMKQSLIRSHMAKSICEGFLWDDFIGDVFSWFGVKLGHEIAEKDWHSMLRKLSPYVASHALRT